jgi:hypothetical protein
MYSNAPPAGIGIFLAKNTVDAALSFISTVIWLDVVLEIVRPITTVVVDAGTV